MIELVAAVPPFGRTTTGVSTPPSKPFDLVAGDVLKRLVFQERPQQLPQMPEPKQRRKQRTDRHYDPIQGHGNDRSPRS